MELLARASAWFERVVASLPTHAWQQPTPADLAVREVGAYAAIPAGAPVRLAKKTSNLFRPRSAVDTPGLDVATGRVSTPASTTSSLRTCGSSYAPTSTRCVRWARSGPVPATPHPPPPTAAHRLLDAFGRRPGLPS